MAYKPSEIELSALEKARRLGTTAIPTNIILRGCRPNHVIERHVKDALCDFNGEKAELLEYEVDQGTYFEKFHNSGTGDNGTSSITLVRVWYYFPGFPVV